MEITLSTGKKLILLGLHYFWFTFALVAGVFYRTLNAECQMTLSLVIRVSKETE